MTCLVSLKNKTYGLQQYFQINIPKKKINWRHNISYRAVCLRTQFGGPEHDKRQSRVTVLVLYETEKNLSAISDVAEPPQWKATAQLWSQL